MNGTNRKSRCKIENKLLFTYDIVNREVENETIQFIYVHNICTLYRV